MNLDFTSKRFWSDGAGSLFLALLVALVIRWAFVEAYVIPSGSMLPTLLLHDHIFVNKFSFGLRIPFSRQFIFKTAGPKRGEIVVFKNPENHSKNFFIKRVVGLPGDKVYFENGNLYINDELIEKSVPNEKKSDLDWLLKRDFNGDGLRGPLNSYVHWEEKLGKHNYSILLSKNNFLPSEYGPYTVPEGHYFMMGDNRDNSHDSRRWKPDKRFVPYENLMGRAMFVWLSCEDVLPVIPICNPLTIRASRFFHSIH